MNCRVFPPLALGTVEVLGILYSENVDTGAPANVVWG